MNNRSFQFNYPAIQKDMKTFEVAIAKVKEEVTEAREAYSELLWLLHKPIEFNANNEPLENPLERRCRIDAAAEHFLEECCDANHATETLLRLFEPDDVFRKRNEVIEKNKRRGYYDEVH